MQRIQSLLHRPAKDKKHPHPMTSITSIHARQIFDSRGNPTVEVDLCTHEGLFRAAVPSGASTGSKEAVELRDGGKAYQGKGVMKAVDNVNNIIAPKLLQLDVSILEQQKIDEIMIDLDKEIASKDGIDGTKGALGANAILAVLLAVCKAGAGHKKMPLWRYIAELAGNETPCLPVPAFNVINGGRHAGNRLAMQEFMILPVGATTFSEAMQIGTEVYHTLAKKIKEKYGADATAVGDEGGFAPSFQDNKTAINLLHSAIAAAGYLGKVQIGMDIAASEFWKENVDGVDCAEMDGPYYDLDFKSKNGALTDKLTSERLAEFYEGIEKLCEDNGTPLFSIEDPFHEDDWEAWEKFNEKHGSSLQVVGDDLTVTNPAIIRKAIDQKACNALLLKVNQIGTVTESIEAVKLAQSNGWGIMTSHRSGETEDTFIADLAVGLSTGQIKTGAPCRSERLAKYNQLLRIEEEGKFKGEKLKFAGENLRKVGYLRPDLADFTSQQ